jgi:hypothetical protein
LADLAMQAIDAKVQATEKALQDKLKEYKKQLK